MSSELEIKQEVPQPTNHKPIETLDQAISLMKELKKDTDKEIQILDASHRRMNKLIMCYNQLSTQLEKITHIYNQNEKTDRG